MFENLLGGLINKEDMTYDTIHDTLKDVAEELGCEFTDFFIMIDPKMRKEKEISESKDKEPTTFVCGIFRKSKSGPPTFVRKITLKEILGIEEEDKKA